MPLKRQILRVAQDDRVVERVALALLASRRDMSRNLYILGATLFFFAVVSFAMTFTTGPYQIGLPGNGSLWKTIALFLLVLSLLSALSGVMTHMYEQVERRTLEREAREREMRRRRRG